MGRPERTHFRRTLWGILLLAVISITALSTSATASQNRVSVDSSATGTITLSTYDPHEVTITLNETLTDPVRLVVSSLNRDIALLVVGRSTFATYVHHLTTSSPTLTFQVQPLGMGKAPIAWSASTPGRGKRFGVFQVQNTSPPPPAPPSTVGQTIKTASNIIIQQSNADPWFEGSYQGLAVDHSIGDNSSFNYEVKLAPDHGGSCSSAAEVSISVADRRTWAAYHASNYARIGIVEGTVVPTKRMAIGDQTVTLQFNNCTDVKTITVYAIPDDDEDFSILTLTHALTQKGGMPLIPSGEGPTLKLWVSEVGDYVRIEHSSPWTPERNDDAAATRDVKNKTAGPYVYLHPSSLAGEPSSTWWDNCNNPDFKYARYCPLPPWNPSTARNPLWLQYYGHAWSEFCIKIPRNLSRLGLPPLPLPSITLAPILAPRESTGSLGSLPAVEFQLYSKVVNEGGECTPAPTDDVHDEWQTFFDASKPSENYMMGNAKIAHADLDQWLNVRVRAVVAQGTDSQEATVTVDPVVSHFYYTFRIREYFQTVGMQGYVSVSRRSYDGPLPPINVPGDDCSKETTYACALNAPTTTTSPTRAMGDIQFQHDADWFAVSLESGRTYRIELAGYAGDSRIHQLEHGYITGVYDSRGTPAQHTHAGGSWTRHGPGSVSLTVGASGTYYVEATHMPWPGLYERTWPHSSIAGYSGAYQLTLSLEE